MGVGQWMPGPGALSELDAVTLDGYGTLLQLTDPLPKLQALAPARSLDAIEAAFKVEANYYVEHSVEGRDEASLARLRADCTAVFNQALGSSLTPEEYIGALEFEVLPRVPETLRQLRAHGLALAVVANWDYSLHEHLRRHRLSFWFDAVVTAGEVGANKPDPRPFHAALERLAVEPSRAVHVGDHPPHDENGARAAGMHFALAPVERLLAGRS